MSFTQLGLAEPLLKAIEKRGFSTPSPIQEKAIPEVLQGKDVLAAAQTGTGKTAGFGLPILNVTEFGGIWKSENKENAMTYLGRTYLPPIRHLLVSVPQSPGGRDGRTTSQSPEA